MSTFFVSAVFSSLAAFGLMAVYGIDQQSAGVYATFGGIALGIVAWAIEDSINDRKRKQMQEYEMKQIQEYAMKQTLRQRGDSGEVPSKDNAR